MKPVGGEEERGGRGSLPSSANPTLTPHRCRRQHATHQPTHPPTNPPPRLLLHPPTHTHSLHPCVPPLRELYCWVDWTLGRNGFLTFDCFVQFSTLSLGFSFFFFKIVFHGVFLCVCLSVSGWILTCVQVFGCLTWQAMKMNAWICAPATDRGLSESLCVRTRKMVNRA